MDVYIARYEECGSKFQMDKTVIEKFLPSVFHPANGQRLTTDLEVKAFLRESQKVGPNLHQLLFRLPCLEVWNLHFVHHVQPCLSLGYNLIVCLSILEHDLYIASFLVSG